MAASSELEQLRDLLLAPEVNSLHSLQQDFATLQRLIRDPEQFSRLLEPVLSDMIRRADPAVSLAILKAVTPFLDRAVRERMEQDQAAMTNALAPASTGAIAIHFAENPGTAAQDVAPLISAAFKEQIRAERDAVIDALYPVIGSTISKYLSETLNTLVQRMNTRIESHLSVRSIFRKIRARFTGVSEAELLLRDSLWCRVDAAFLIHKNSGLVIAQSQNPDVPPLDSDLLSGMLTAIRSLFNESMASGDKPRELDQIAYGDSKIVLEVAGFFYVAAVVRGLPTDSFRTKLRETVGAIVQLPGDAITHFTGDQSQVPRALGPLLQALVQGTYDSADRTRRRTPYGVLWAGALLLLAICIPLGIHLYRNSLDRDSEVRTRAALLAADSIGFKEVAVEIDRDRVQLSGPVSNEYQRASAARLAEMLLPEAVITNHITTRSGPYLPILLGKQVEALGATLNTVEGVLVQTHYRDGGLAVAGLAPDSATVEGINRTFADLPGVRSFRSTVSPHEFEMVERLLFAFNSTEIRPVDRAVLERVIRVARQAPWAGVHIIGHSDLTGEDNANRRIALGRATSVRALLLQSGIPSGRVSIEGNPGPPPDVIPSGQDSLGRCVRFRLRSPKSDFSE